MATSKKPETFINFSEPLQCSDSECERMTNWGHLVFNWHGNGERACMLYPLCWEHGYAYREYDGPASRMTPVEIAERYASIARFVVGYHDGRGHAVVIAACKPEDVPGLQVWTRDDFESDKDWKDYNGWHISEHCWHVRYEMEGQRPEYLYVVWNFDDFVFELYRPAA